MVSDVAAGAIRGLRLFVVLRIVPPQAREAARVSGRVITSNFIVYSSLEFVLD
jgi:hypothetical protein